LTPNVALTVGSHQLSYSVSDTAGNESTASNPLTLEVDTQVSELTATLANDTGTSDSDKITNNNLVNVSGIEDSANWYYRTSTSTDWIQGSGTSFTLSNGANTYELKQTDTAGNTSDIQSFAATLDTSNPIATFTSPADGSTSEGVSGELVLSFNELVEGKGTNNIQIFEIDSTTAALTLNAKDARITGTGTNTQANIAYAGLIANKSYYVKILAGAFEDKAGNAYAGLDTEGQAGWNFTTPSASISMSMVSTDNQVNAQENDQDIDVQGQISIEVASQLAKYNASGIQVTFTPGQGGATVTATQVIYNSATGVWSAKVAANTLVHGKSYTATVTANPSSEGTGAGVLSASQIVTVDTQRPNVLTATLADDTGTAGDTITSNNLVNVSGIEDRAKWYYRTSTSTDWTLGSGTTFRLSNGANTYELKQTDAAGNTSEIKSFTATLDTANPTATISERVSRKNTATLNVTSSEIGTAYLVRYYDSGFENNTDEFPAGWGILQADYEKNDMEWLKALRTTSAHQNDWRSIDILDANILTVTLSLSGLNNGLYKLITIDKAGNKSTLSTTDIRIDNVAPNVTINTIAGDGTINKNERLNGFSLTGTTELPRGWGVGTLSIATDTGTAVVATIDESGNWRADIGQDNLPDTAGASVTFKITATDKAGNESITYSTATIDTQVAALTATLADDTGTAGDTITKKDLVNVTGIEDGATWYYRTSTSTDWTLGSGTTFKLSNGSNTYELKQTDAAGNTSVTQSFTAELDTSNPTATLSARVSLQNTKSIQVQSSEAGTAYLVRYFVSGFENNLKEFPAGWGILQADYENGKMNWLTALNEQPHQNDWRSIDISNANSLTATLSLSGLNDGLYKLITIDKAGNISTLSTTGIRIDNVNPNVTIDTIAGDGKINKNERLNGFSLTGTTEVPRGWGGTLSVTTIGYSNVVAATSIDNDTGRWTATIGQDNLPDTASGSVIFTITATDTAGNKTVTTSTATIDTRDPGILTATLADDTGTAGDNKTNNSRVNVSGIEDGTKWYYRTSTSTDWTLGSDSWFNLSSGANTYELKQIDAVGNESAIQSFTATLDTLAPGAVNIQMTSVESSRHYVSSSKTSYYNSFDGNDNERGSDYFFHALQIKLNESTSKAFLIKNSLLNNNGSINYSNLLFSNTTEWRTQDCPINTNTYGLDMVGLKEGEYSLFAVDAAGNISQIPNNKIVIDNTAPTVNINATQAVKDLTFNQALDTIRVTSNEDGIAYLVRTGDFDYYVGNDKTGTAAGRVMALEELKTEIFTGDLFDTKSKDFDAYAMRQVNVEKNVATSFDISGIGDGMYSVVVVDRAGNSSYNGYISPIQVRIDSSKTSTQNLTIGAWELDATKAVLINNKYYYINKYQTNHDDLDILLTGSSSPGTTNLGTNQKGEDARDSVVTLDNRTWILPDAQTIKSLVNNAEVRNLWFPAGTAVTKTYTSGSHIGILASDPRSLPGGESHAYVDFSLADTYIDVFAQNDSDSKLNYAVFQVL
jgi:hypothetical protein